MKARTKTQKVCRIVREYFGLTVEDLAKELNVSEKTIYRFETENFKRWTHDILICSIWYNEKILLMMDEIQKKYFKENTLRWSDDN